MNTLSPSHTQTRTVLPTNHSFKLNRHCLLSLLLLLLLLFALACIAVHTTQRNNNRLTSHCQAFTDPAITSIHSANRGNKYQSIFHQST